MSLTSLLAICFASACALCPMAALAEKADRSKPMLIEADTLRVDDLKQITVASGKVVVNKGSILIRGAKVEVRQDPEGYQFGTVTAEPGSRAFFRQKREGLDEFIEGEGETIVYDGKADTVRFVRRAEMRRYKGSQLFDETSGNLIVYDNTSDVFTVDSTNPPGTPAGAGSRVRAMLTPSPAPAGSASATVRPGPAPVLRPSATTGGEKK